MESSLRKYVHGGKMKEEIMKVESSDDEGSKEDMTHIKGGNGSNNRRRENSTPPPSSRHNTPSEKKESNSIKMEGSSSAETNLRISASTSQQKEDPLALAKAEMGEVIEENQRLKIHLDKVTKDYQALQMQFNEFLQQEPTTKSTTSSTHINTEEPHDDLVSLSLGRTSSIDVEKTHEPPISAPNKEGENGNGNGNRGDHEKGLLLGLGYKLKSKNDKEILGESSTMSPEKSVEELREEGEQTWPPQKIPKRSVEDEISQQNPTKRARVSLRVRCDSPTMNDGCQWRKYGQKIAKGNPCPRAYYRCTVATNCPVRKQVQRCAEDMSILITTYEGNHNHPLPVAATAIASTTSAAARMLLSGSSTSSSSSTNPSYHNSTLPSTNINGLNYYFSADNSKSKPFYLPNSTISSSPSAFPTITLDLTSTSSSSSLSHLTRITNFSPRQPSTNLNFSSSESNTLPLSWSNQINSFNFQRQPFYQENIYQPYTFKNMSSMPQDTLAEATKAITSDPNFQSALVEALSSIIGSSSRSNLGNLGDKNNKVPSQSLRIGDQSFPILSSFAPTQNSANCASNFLNMNPSSMSSTSQSGSVFSLHPSSPFPLSKSKSTSPDDTRDHPQ